MTDVDGNGPSNRNDSMPPELGLEDRLLQRVRSLWVNTSVFVRVVFVGSLTIFTLIFINIENTNVINNYVGNNHEEYTGDAGYRIGILERKLIEIRKQVSHSEEIISEKIVESAQMKMERDAFRAKINELELEIASANAKPAVKVPFHIMEKIRGLEKIRIRLQAERNQLGDQLAVEEETLSNTKSALHEAMRRESTQKKTYERLTSELKLKIQSLDQRLKVLREDGQRLTQTHSMVLSERDGLQRQLVEASKSVSFWTSKHAQAEQLSQARDAELRIMKELAASKQLLTSTKAVWGASALAPDGIFYSIENQISKQLASENVLLLCKGASGKKCVLKSVYQNSCFAIARINNEGARPNNWAYSVEATWQIAETNALESCFTAYGSVCTVRFTSCAPAELSKPE